MKEQRKSPKARIRCAYAFRICNYATRVCDISQDERGDVLMEYVLLTVLIILPLVGVQSFLFDPTGPGNNDPAIFDFGESTSGGNFGMLGQAFVDHYRMAMSGISLPVP